MKALRTELSVGHAELLDKVVAYRGGTLCYKIQHFQTYQSHKGTHPRYSLVKHSSTGIIHLDRIEGV